MTQIYILIDLIGFCSLAVWFGSNDQRTESPVNMELINVKSHVLGHCKIYLVILRSNQDMFSLQYCFEVTASLEM